MLILDQDHVHMTDDESRIDALKQRVAKLESIVLDQNYSSQKANNIERLVIDHIDDTSTQHLVIIALYLQPKQTKTEIKKMLQDWGKAVGSWFQGGNLNNRLLNKGVIKKIEVNEKNEDLFSLTGKGENMAKELLQKIKES